LKHSREEPGEVGEVGEVGEREEREERRRGEREGVRIPLRFRLLRKLPILGPPATEGFFPGFLENFGFEILFL
jgi:hypothetical protein